MVLFWDNVPLPDFLEELKKFINSKEYVLSELNILDIPYGEHIYNIEYPENNRYGRKIE